MKTIITGGSGFIGSHVVDVVMAQGHEVIIYDLDAPRYGQPCRFVRGDTRDVERLSQTAQGAQIIYHIAAEANVNRFFESPLYSNDITSQASACVLEASRKAGKPRVILASTEWIYGSIAAQGDEQITEETPYAENPDHLYTASKIAAELFCKTYLRLYGVPYTIMRFGIPFGERARPETVTPIFIRKLLAGDTITIHGDGSQTRQFIYVKDLAAGIGACVQEAATNEIFNINGNEKISVIQIVRTLEEILGKKANITFVPDRAGNFKGRFISSAKAERLLGWKTRRTYKDAMTHYVEWFLGQEGKKP
jgi:UDP-glucose 4-epimerase